ncbi:hypothetical protein ACFVS9_28015 [Streptomyces sp. NPDC058008]|uniref:hypothetical protein n=1 Tax=Streptomyces sp. NPDC058008 TaxID=3346303 RepID=UPI0036EA4CF5
MSNAPTNMHPPYTGPETRCTKCGSTGAYTEYMASGECIHSRASEVIGFAPNPRLHRECGRCGHQWDEATVEQEEAPHA